MPPPLPASPRPRHLSRIAARPTVPPRPGRHVTSSPVDPLGLLRSIRDGLRPGGRYLCLEINCSDQAAENVGPVAALLYGFSVLYCMTTSLAEGGEGLGTLGLPEMENPFNSLYELAR